MSMCLISVCCYVSVVFFFKQNTAYEMRISDCSSDVCSSDLFKVDSDGNQLPYIDRLSASVNADVQTLVLKVVNGEIDYQDRHINANSNRAVRSEESRVGQECVNTCRSRW